MKELQSAEPVAGAMAETANNQMGTRVKGITGT